MKLDFRGVLAVAHLTLALPRLGSSDTLANRTHMLTAPRHSRSAPRRGFRLRPRTCRLCPRSLFLQRTDIADDVGDLVASELLGVMRLRRRPKPHRRHLPFATHDDSGELFVREALYV